MPNALPPFPEQLDVDLAGLSAAAEPWVSQLSVNDQRIQATPDARNIRYYQTTGLLDRPVRYDGRNARYGLRHLLQLIAIRALQSRGLSLSQVQAALAGVTNAELQHVASQVLGLKSSTTEDVINAKNTVSPADTVAPTHDFPTPTALIAVELTAGIVVTIDTRIHPDIAHTISVLRRAISANDAPLNAPAPQGDLS